MVTLVDDVGSFPLPFEVGRGTFDKAYCSARNAIKNGKDPTEDEFTKRNFCNVVINSFRKKVLTGLDIVNYPQHYDGVKQINDVIHQAMEKGTFVVEEKDAFLPEIHILRAQSKSLSTEFGKKILLRVSLFGPMELYLKEIGSTLYHDVLDGFAETVRRFAKNSILNTEYIKTEVVSIDEPSFGFLNINAEKETICKTLEKAFSFEGVTRQIHLHSSSQLPDLLTVKNLDVLSFEYAASPKNIEGISKRMLDETAKNIRVGVARTDIDSMTAEIADQGMQKPTELQLIEHEDTIRKRYFFAKQKFGDRMTFTGPDCGLGSWPSQSAAQILLERTVKAIKKVEKE